MAIRGSGGNLGDGGSVNASPVACTYVFTWAGTASSSTPATLASYVTAWSTGASVTVGAVLRTLDGYVIGCVGAGTTAATGTGPTLASFAVDTRIKLLCGASIPVITDGTAKWILLSGPGNVINLAVYNRHASAVLELSSLATVAAGAGVPVAPNYGGQNVDGGTPETLYVISSAASAFSVVVYV